MSLTLDDKIVGALYYPVNREIYNCFYRVHLYDSSRKVQKIQDELQGALIIIDNIDTALQKITNRITYGE